MLNFLSTYNSLLMLIASLLSATATVIVAILTFINLREFKNTRIEENRAYIVFFFEKSNDGIFSRLVIKNYGKTAGKLLYIDILPKLDYRKCRRPLNFPLITDSKNIFLAPNQSVSSIFDFANYPEKKFNITLVYESLGKTFKETYDIDINYKESLLSTSPNIKDCAGALKEIANNISELNQKLV